MLRPWQGLCEFLPSSKISRENGLNLQNRKIDFASQTLWLSSISRAMIGWFIRMPHLWLLITVLIGYRFESYSEFITRNYQNIFRDLQESAAWYAKNDFSQKYFRFYCQLWYLLKDKICCSVSIELEIICSESSYSKIS